MSDMWHATGREKAFKEIVCIAVVSLNEKSVSKVKDRLSFFYQLKNPYNENKGNTEMRS